MRRTTYPNLTDFLQHQEQEIQQDVPPFIDHMLGKVDATIAAGHRVLVLALTKRSCEEVTNFMLAKGYKTYYLHSEIDTMDRWEIIKKLKTGEIDVLVGVNLLREGIDLPEVGFIAILDADKEGFLRSTPALIQNIGRAARNPMSEVALYADEFTPSMVKALRETYRRRGIQQEHNRVHDITPQQAISNVKSLDVVKSDEDISQSFQLMTRGKVKRLKRMTKKEKEIVATNLKKQLDEAIAAWKFEEAAVLRDQLKELSGE